MPGLRTDRRGGLPSLKLGSMRIPMGMGPSFLFPTCPSPCMRAVKIDGEELTEYCSAETNKCDSTKARPTGPLKGIRVRVGAQYPGPGLDIGYRGGGQGR